MQINISTPEETRTFGKKLAQQAGKGNVYGLIGELGSGKTEMVRGFVQELAPDITVRSPSFSIVNTYPANKFTIHHFDFFRLKDADELFEIGFDDYIEDEDAVCLIEWADMFRHALPERTVYIRFVEKGENSRIIYID